MWTLQEKTSLHRRLHAAEQKLVAMHRYQARRDADIAHLQHYQEYIIRYGVTTLVLMVVAYTWEHLALVCFLGTCGYLITRWVEAEAEEKESRKVPSPTQGHGGGGTTQGPAQELKQESVHHNKFS